MVQTATNPQTGERVQWNGSQWVPLDGASQPAKGPVYGPPPKAMDPLTRQKTQIDIAKGQADLQILPYDIESKKLDIEKKRLEAAQGPQMSDDAQKLAGKRATLESIVGQVNRVEQLYRGGFRDEALGILSSIGEFLPSQEQQQFDSAGQGLADQGLAAFRVPGVGSQSDMEAKQFADANRPQASDFDARIEEKLRNIKTRVDANRQAYGLPPAEWLANDQLDKTTNPAELVINPGGSDITPTQNGTQTVQNPQLSGVRGKYLALLEQGAPAGDVIRFLRSAGVTDPKVLQSALKQLQFRKANPNVPIENYNTDQLDLMDVPLSSTESMMNDAAQSGLGAYTMRAGNAVTANNLDSIVGMTGGNEERARIALQDASRMNPLASLAGDLSGGVMAAMTGEAALARLGANPGVLRALAADSGYGAAAGAGAADDGSRFHGAIMGGLTGAAGSLGGQALARTAGSAISPSGGSLGDLYASGVRPTPGQRLVEVNGGRGLSGLVGRAVNATEEGLSSVPILGSSIRGARQEARDQFQVGAYNMALEDIGKKLPEGMGPGTAPYAFTKQAFKEAYDKARSGMTVAADEQLANEITDIAGKAATLAEPSIRRFESIVQNKLIRRISGNALDGATYKKIVSELGDTIRGIRKSQSGDGELADVLEDLVGSIDGAARRHSSPEAVAALDAADAGYAKFVRIRDAAKARGGQAGEFSPTQFDRSVQRNTSGKYSDAYLRGDALMQDYAQQGMSLVDRIPNSGTPERLAVGGTLMGGAAYAEPSSLGLAATLSALYAPGVRKATKGAMAPRPKTKAIADQVKKRARITGAVGAASAVRDD